MSRYYQLAMKNLSAAEVRQRLMSNPWFARREPLLQAALLEVGTTGQLEPGQWIYSEGDNSDGIWAVLDGVVKLELSVGRNRSVVMNLIGPNTFTGQIERPTPRARAVTAHAVTNATIFSIPGSAMPGIMTRFPSMWGAVAELLDGQLRGTLRVAAEALGLPPRARIANRVLALWERLPKGPAIPLTQTDLANMTGLSRKSANGHLQALQRIDAIRLAYGGIEVLDPAKLALLAER